LLIIGGVTVQAYKELAACSRSITVGVCRHSHRSTIEGIGARFPRENAKGALPFVVIVWIAIPREGRTALDPATRRNPMEGGVVIESLLRQLDHTFDRCRCQGGDQRDPNVPQIRFENQLLTLFVSGFPIHPRKDRPSIEYR